MRPNPTTRAKAAGLCCRTAGIGAPTPEEGYANLARAVAAGADGTTIDWPLAGRAWLEQRSAGATR
jgi:glycerophosphoryl diester phosphodiesterase